MSYSPAEEWEFDFLPLKKTQCNQCGRVVAQEDAQRHIKSDEVTCYHVDCCYVQKHRPDALTIEEVRK